VTVLGRPPEDLIFADESADSASRFSFHRRDLLKAVRCLSQQDWEVESERITLEALEAISAGMLNIFKHPQRMAVLERIWEELQSQWYSIHGRSDAKDAAYSARDSWGRLNARVGLEKHWRKRDQRYEVTNLTADLRYVELEQRHQGLSIRNIHLRGLRIVSGTDTLDYGPIEITLHGETQVTLRGRIVNSTKDGASVSLDPLAVEDRDKLNALLKGAVAFYRKGRPKDLGRETALQS
jgi:hypothetical protein